MESIFTPLSESILMINIYEKTTNDQQRFTIVYKKTPTAYVYLIATDRYDEFVSSVRNSKGLSLYRNICQLIEMGIISKIY